jgi:DNA-directed RNA polymerase subunit beta'
MAQLAEIGGKVSIEEARRNAMTTVTITDEETGEIKIYQIPYSAGLKVVDGQRINRGDELTEGSLNPHDVLLDMIT